MHKIIIAILVLLLFLSSGYVWMETKEEGSDKMAHEQNNKASDINANGIRVKMCDDISEEFKRLLKKQVEPWVFYNSKGAHVKKFDGEEISMSGCEYNDQSKMVFFNYIKPFVEDVIKRKIEETVELAKDKKVSLSMVLGSTEANLSGGIDTVYRKMQEIDRRLRGGGDPKSVPMRDVSLEIKTMDEFLDRQIKIAEDLNLTIPEVKSKEPFYKSLWKILVAIGILLAVIWTVIQIYESETFKKLFHSSDTKIQVPLNKMMKANIFAEVSKDGKILRSNEFPWKIKKTKNKEGDILYSIIDRRGDATAVSVIPDTPKYTVYQSYDGMVIKDTCPEEKISNFTITLKY